MGYSRGIHGVYICIEYVSGMYRVCIGYVSEGIRIMRQNGTIFTTTQTTSGKIMLQMAVARGGQKKECVGMTHSLLIR